MGQTAPHRMCAPDLLGAVMLLGLAAWVARAVVALGDHGHVVYPLGRIIRS